MKFSAAALFLFAGCASAGGPQLSLTLKDGGYGSVKSALSPSLSFGGESNGLEYGASLDLSSDSLPKSIWGQTKSTVGGWSIKTRAELSQGKYDYGGKSSGAYITVEGTDDDETYVWGSGVVSDGDVHALKVGGKKIIETDAGKIMVAPRYSFENSDTEVVLGYEKDDTKAYLTLAEDQASLLVKQKLNDANSATIKADKDSGFVAATLTNESDLGSTKFTLTPEDIDVQINNDGWVAGITTSRKLDSEPQVRFSKSLTFGA
eukprot:jgi/Psemu1/242580/estExt_Genewise1.C_2900032